MLQVKLTLASGFWQKASCLNPYYSAGGGGRVKYSNYPQCGDIPPDCQRCDEFCALSSGRAGRLDY